MPRRTRQTIRAGKLETNAIPTVVKPKPAVIKLSQIRGPNLLQAMLAGLF
jgi:hypothetical protein